VPGQPIDFLTRGEVPQANRVVEAGRNQPRPVCGEGDIRDPTFFVRQLDPLLAGRQVPYANGAVHARSDGLAAGRRHDAVDLIAMGRVDEG
jgi:hypothetical protein